MKTAITFEKSTDIPADISKRVLSAKRMMSRLFKENSNLIASVAEFPYNDPVYSDWIESNLLSCYAATVYQGSKYVYHAEYLKVFDESGRITVVPCLTGDTFSSKIPRNEIAFYEVVNDFIIVTELILFEYVQGVDGLLMYTYKNRWNLRVPIHKEV